MKLTKTTIGLSAATLLLSLISTSILAAPNATATTSFKDVKSSDWYYGSVQKLISKGLVNGFEDGTFKPNKEIGRAEFLKLVGAALELNIPANESGKPWYTPYVGAAVEAGIHKTADFNGNWTQPISRQEMARITVRAVDEKLRNVKTTDSQLAYEATKRGILSGLTGGELGLKEKSTRAQATVIIDRVLTLLSGGQLPADKRATSYAEVAYTGTNVQTVWNGHFRTLPFKTPVGYNVDATFKKILIIDGGDKDGPYSSWIKGLIKIDRSSSSKDYILAFEVDMENKKAVHGEVTTFTSQVGSILLKPAFVVSGGSPFNTSQALYLDKINKKTVWALFTVSKDDLEKTKENNNPSFYFMWFSNNHNTINLGKDSNRTIF